MSNPVKHRVVCAAMKITTMRDYTFFAVGVRYDDKRMESQIDGFCALDDSMDECYHAANGFLDNNGDFLMPAEAWKVAEAAGQIIRRCGGDDADGGTLYSENLY